MSKAGKKSELQQKSPAEFFAENKNIAGFDNVRPPPRAPGAPSAHSAFFLTPPAHPSQPGKSLYTTIRELVENALDSAESIRNLPHVEITM
jgi:DNA topoisomerase VI subunit B